MRFSIATVALTFVTSVAAAASGSLKYNETAPGQVIKDGVKLRILPVGDSVTVGFLSSDGNGYRLKLQEDLSANDVVFAGTVFSGTMKGPYYAAWSGKTIKFIADNVGPSLEQRPNVILLHAGTNDMNPNPAISTEGNDPKEAAERLGALIDQMTTACPDATILVAQIINTCDSTQRPQTEEFQKLVPAIVEERRNASKHVLAVDFAALGDGILRNDCIHPSDEGYSTMGDYWYDFIAQIPTDWIKQPVGDDPDRTKDEAAMKSLSSDTNGANAFPQRNWALFIMVQVLVALNLMSK